MIDVHLHAMPGRYRAALTTAFGTGVRTPKWNPPLALEFMDRCGVSSAILSLSAPGTHFGDNDHASLLSRGVNDEFAQLCVESARFGAFATLPLPAVKLACAEAERVLGDLKLDGISLLTSYNGIYLGDPTYDPLLEVLDAHSAVVLIHPSPSTASKSVGLNIPVFAVEYPFETTRAVVNLVFADVAERFPNIRFILSHGGGVIPFLSWRIAAIAAHQLSLPSDVEGSMASSFPTRLVDRAGQLSISDTRSLLRNFYFDVALTGDAAGLGALLEFAGEDRVLFGSDWPYAHDRIVNDQLASMDDPEVIPIEARKRIGRAAATSLFPRLKTKTKVEHL